MTDLEADLLIANAKNKQLEQELADYHHLSKLVNGKMAENQHLRRINENLQSQFAESRRREQEAVEFIKYLDHNYSGYMAEDERFEQWRDKAAQAGEGGK